ncbi:Transcription factor HES-1-B [Holothuria leucospilota]|uniref:Transcription factor HES-1-B n=1 Tax=Holothuria leucospilota TaxID=206669 RepID=A0A9Q0YJW8_HOLLE|nr:Transcription factor HES-1-B [Holothuria leucospilota]
MDRILQSDVRQHKRRPRINKHLTERKRRARINDSLLQLKSIVYPALNDKLSQSSKVEKADILEMTLLYLRGLQGQTYCKSTADQFQAGFTKCFGEVSQFLLSCDSVDSDTRVKLMNHLADFCTRKMTPPAVPAQPEHQIFSPKTTGPYSDPQPKTSLPHDTMLSIRAPPLRELNFERRKTATIEKRYPSVIQEQHYPEVTVLTPPPSPVIRQHPTPKDCVMSGCIDAHGPSYTSGALMWRPWLR